MRSSRRPASVHGELGLHGVASWSPSPRAACCRTARPSRILPRSLPCPSPIDPFRYPVGAG
ncbi:hypothetical protein ACFFX0_30205 [Citricoccus parietis]|uniref:Uncharacterized protein n=1 Tax=Citricoccus parietis TaxID=592307 RepID=A0ABV5G8J7_9MICC